MKGQLSYHSFDDHHLNLKETELRLGLPGTDEEPEKKFQSSTNIRGNNNKRGSSKMGCDLDAEIGEQNRAPPTKAQVVGWPPVRFNRRNCFQMKKSESDGSGVYVKVSMDGAPYLRKIDLEVYNSYPELLKALESMFNCTIGGYSEREGYDGSDYAPTYEDKDGDWMLAGDVPWDMFITSCKRLRIMKGSDAKGFGCQ